MGDIMRFIISHGGGFVHMDNNWKWLGNRTTSILFGREIQYEELVNKLYEKLNIDSKKYKIQMKFKVPNMNVPPAYVVDDENLQWYISLHTHTPLCVVKDEYAVEDNKINLGAQQLSPQENALSDNDEGGLCELQAPLMIHDTKVAQDEDNQLTEDELLCQEQDGIYEKQISFSKKQIHTRLRLQALTEKFHFKVQKSNQRSLTVCYVDTTCRWLVCASKVKSSEVFMIRRYIPEHTCSLDVRCNAKNHATSTLIGEHIMRQLDDANQPYVPVGIIGDIEREFGVRISYNKAWWGKEKGLVGLCGSPEHSFLKLSSYCRALTEKNPGTVMHIELDSRNRFLYFFLALGPCIRGFRDYMRQVIYVNGSHLNGPYKGTLLVAAAQDSNLQIYPIAWGIVDAETNASWEWFMSKLKDVVQDSDQLVFVSDRKNSIKRAIIIVFPLSHHGACMWHIEKKIIVQYSNSNAVSLFKRAAMAYRVSKFQIHRSKCI